MTQTISANLPLENFQQIVLSSLSLDELYLSQIELSRRVSLIYKDMEPKLGKPDIISLKAELAWAENLIEVCKKRQDDVRRINPDVMFRMKAEKLLTPDQVAKIREEIKNEIKKK